MAKLVFTLLALGVVFLSASLVSSQSSNRVVLERANEFEVLLEDDRYITHAIGNVIFRTETGRIYCDSAVWRKRESVDLKGNVVVDDEDYRLAADSVFYNIVTSEALARGSNVELWSYKDSLYAVGLHAYFDNEKDFFYMEERPVLYLNYPDSARMVEVIADLIEYDANSKRTEASGTVIITSKDVSSFSDCAIMNTADNTLDLFGNPRAKRGHSEVTGELISIYFEEGMLRKIDVIDSAHGEFSEPVDSAETDFDRSILKGKRIILTLEQGQLDNVLCYGQAYSWYYPSTRGSNEFNENTVSGDTIRFSVEGERLTKVDVIDGAIGTFITGKIYGDDTLAPPVVDTIDYSSRFIEYDLIDSMITLKEASHIHSGTVVLDAHEIFFDTKRRVIEAYSAAIDTMSADANDPDRTDEPATTSLLPNTIPVILKDGTDEVYGDYLEYSIDTEKGRIVQSKSAYEAGFYYGKKLFREQKHIFYVDGGTYSTCDKGEPHYHFYSKSMKLIEGEKLIARPVVFYIGRIPILALPYYVFPLKKGRHSGFLPFTFGKFERGDRYVQNVGYYWAASEYWDWQGSFDYHEINQYFTINSAVHFRKRYVFNGYVTGKDTRGTSYNRSAAAEGKSRRWVLNAGYNHTFSPSFNINASGSFQSDAQYFTDLSSNLDERLNRVVSSRVNFSKKFGKSTALSGYFKHDVDLDRETRTDYIPSVAFSLPTNWLFGSGRLNAEGKLEQKWYHNVTFRYSPNLLNYSRRVTKPSYDTTITIDSVTMQGDTIKTITVDTVSDRSRKEYAKINHNPRISLPTITLAKYFILTPSFNYKETWFKIFETDQAPAAPTTRPDASFGTFPLLPQTHILKQAQPTQVLPGTYRTYSYSGGAGLKTALYGTVYPNAFGLVGLRQVITPSVSYSFSPEIDRHPEVRAYAGGGAGSRKSSVMSFRLEQLYQAKVRQDETERSLNLLSLTSSFSYDFEKEEKPLSSLGTAFSISTLPGVTLSGRMTHSFYDLITDELSFWSPYLMSFSLNTSFTLSSSKFLFDDDVAAIPKGADSASQLSTSSKSKGRKGWNLNVTYSYSESGRDAGYRKSSFVRFTLGFNLTPATSITYSQNYDIVEKLTVSNAVNIVRKIHCWTGSLYWVPIGSNRGFGFKLNVTALPEIKIDQNHDTFSSGLFRHR